MSAKSPKADKTHKTQDCRRRFAALCRYRRAAGGLGAIQDAMQNFALAAAFNQSVVTAGMMRTVDVFRWCPADLTRLRASSARHVAINRSVSELPHSQTRKVVVTNGAPVLITVMNWTRR
jgi:hypothetical protein